MPTPSAIGVVLVVLATASYGLAGNLTVPLQQRYGALPVLARAQLVALVLTLPYALVGIRGVVVLGGLARGRHDARRVEHRCRVRRRSHAHGTRSEPTRGSVDHLRVAPVVSIVLGVVFRDEIFDGFGAVGVLLVLLGAYLASRAEHPQPAVPVE